jgi:hypothetical protein
MNKNLGVNCNVRQCRHNVGGNTCNLSQIKVSCGCAVEHCTTDCTCCESFETL